MITQGFPVGVLAQGGGAAPAYDPGMMNYTAGYYSDTTVTTTGNKRTAVVRFNIASFSGGGYMRLLNNIGGTSANSMQVAVFSNDYSDATLRNKLRFICQATGGGVPCLLVSIDDVADGTDKTAFMAYDGDAGAATFYINGVDADDTGWGSRALTTGSLDNTATTTMGVGANSTGSNPTTGAIGYVGFDDSYLTNPTDFYHPTNGLQELDESGWTEWGAQPLYWQDEGTLTANLGTAGNMTANGTITGPA